MPSDRHSLNRAFGEAGLRFQWDEAIWAQLADLPGLREQLRYYLTHHQPHLLAVYDADFLGRLVEERLQAPVHARLEIEAHSS
ncbi:MAG TPA: hypothetical protein VN878_09535 [Usitatibacter sp.]|nr:hypothetical protein [Usitatibacter sp.]